MAKILDINTNLQNPKFILKDGNNLVRQITDKAQNVPFVQTDSAKQFIYNYGGYLENQVGVNNTYVSVKAAPQFNGVFLIDMWLYVTDYLSSDVQSIIGADNSSTRGWDLYLRSSEIRIYSGLSAQYVLFTMDSSDLNTWKRYTSYVNTITGKIISYKNNQLHKNVFATPSPLYNMGNNSWVFGGDLFSTNRFFKGNIKGVHIYDSNDLGINTVTPSTTIGNKEPFTYLKRYKDDGNKVFFLSSRYLKDAVIDSTNQITSIKDEISEITFNRYAVGLEPELTKKGLLFGQSSVKRIDANSGALIKTFNENSVFWASCWFMPTTGYGTGNKWFFNSKTNFTSFYHSFIYDYPSSGKVGFLFGTAHELGTVSLNTYAHVALAFDKQNLYGFLNGVLKYKAAHIINDRTANFFSWIGAFTTAQNGAFNGYIDDALIVMNEIPIDPTGYEVGDKVFEPPRRGSLDNYIDGNTTYNGGKYTFDELYNMINNQGYIPIATTTEFYSIYLSGSRVMGLGTPFESLYTTGTDKKYVQVNNLDFAAYVTANSLSAISGIYDGNLLDVVLYFEKISAGLALFSGLLAGGIIRNVISRGSVNSINQGGVSGIAYYIREGGLIENCINYATILGTNGAGITALNGGTVRNCVNFGEVACIAGSSGIVNTNYPTGIIENCVNYAKTESTNGSYGGLFSQNQGTIRKSCNYGESKASQYYVGGFGGSNIGLIEDCFCINNVTAGLGYAGGFIGRHTAGQINRCYCVGTISGTNPLNGFCGSTSGGAFSNNYYDSTVSGKSDTIGATPKTTAELKNGNIPDTTIFVDWDPNKWNSNDSDYPKLKGNIGIIKRLQRI